jgi:membrane protein
MTSSVTIFITTQIALIMDKIAFLGILSPLISVILKMLPYGIVWVLFSFLYIFMPNTKVNVTSGVLAGIVAGTLYQIVQFGYITFQVGAAKYNAIYGSFAALPLFLIWLQISWLIILFGAEFSFAHQNVDTYEFEPDSLKISRSFKRLLSLQITHLLVSYFSEGKGPLTAVQISQRLEAPIRLVHQILHELTACGIVSDTQAAEFREPAYQPARDISTLTIQYVINALEDRGTNTIPVAQTNESKAISEILLVFRNEAVKSPANRLLKDI